MVARKVFVLIFFSGLFSNGFCQSAFDVLGDPGAIVTDLRVHREETIVVAATSEGVQVWNYGSKTLVNSWSAPGILAIDLRDNVVAGVSRSGELIGWNITNGEEVFRFPTSSSPLLCVTWVDSVTVAAGSNDGTLYKVTTVSGAMTTAKLSGSVTAISKMSGDLMAGTSDGKLVVYEASGLKLKSTRGAHKGWLREIQASDSTETFITVGDDGVYKKWSSSLAVTSKMGFGFSGWITSVDETGSGSAAMIAIGKLSGDVIVSTAFGKYTARTKGTVNQVSILRTYLGHEIRLIIATHGAGLQLWSAKNMNFKR